MVKSLMATGPPGPLAPIVRARPEFAFKIVELAVAPWIVSESVVGRLIVSFSS